MTKLMPEIVGMEDRNNKSLSCAVCDPGQTFSRYRVVDGYQYLRCEGCRQVFLETDRNAQPTFYSDTFDYLASKKTVTRHSIEYWSVPQLFSKYRAVFNHFFNERLSHLRRAGYGNGPLLDIGCGYGFFVKYLQERGIDAVGIDTAAEQIAWANRHWQLDLQVCPVEDFQPDRQFEAAVMADVLEHVWNPVAVLSRVREFIKPGGLLAVQVPNLLGFKLPPGHSWGVPHHIWQFDRRTLGKVLRKSGYHELAFSTGVLGVIGMHEHGGPTFIQKLYMRFARHFKVGNRLLVICRRER